MRAQTCFLSQLLFIFFACTFSAQATQYSWTGTTSVAWRTTTNWNPNGIPGSSDTVTIVSQVNNPLLSQNETVGKFTMTSGSFVLLTYTFTINGAAKFDGGTLSGTATKAVKPRGSRATFDGTTFNAEVDAVCGDIVLSGSIFNYPARFEQTGSSTGNGVGGNTFNSTAYFKNGGTAYFLLASTNGNTFKDTTTFFGAGTQEIVACKATSYFYGPIILNSTTSAGVNFGATDGDTSYFTSASSIKIGTSGFSAGTLNLIRFFQLDSTRQNLTLSGTAVLNISYSKFHGSFTATAPSTVLKYTTFNDSLTLTKTGSTAALAAGGNIFNGVTLIKNHSSSQWRFANEVGDTFNNKVTFYTDSTGLLRPFYIETSFVNDDLIATGSKIEYAASTGTVVFGGSKNQHIKGTKAIDFYRVRIDKTTGTVAIDTTVNITDSLNLKYGNLVSTSNRVLILKSGSKANGNGKSFVHGPLRKIGNVAFTFPIGKDYSYAPAKITAPSNTTDAFTAEYFYAQQQHGSSCDTSLGLFSTCSYWNISRTTGSSTPYVYLGWDTLGCGLSDTTNLKVANWNGSTWKDKGRDSIFGDAYSGFIKAGSNSLTYGDFTWAYKHVANFAVTPVFYDDILFPNFNHDLEPDMLGYNGANTLDPGTSWNDLMHPSTGDQALLNKHCTTLRIPAGTVANYFDWRSGWMIREEHLPHNWNYIERFLDKAPFTTFGSTLPNEMAEFKDNSDLICAKPIHCLNMLSSGFNYQLASLFRAKMLNLSTQYIELGNEYYLNNEQYIQEFPSVIDYGNAANEWCANLKSHPLFEPKIAIVGATSPSGIPGRRRLWLENLMKSISPTAEVDAVVLHHYIGSGIGNVAFGTSNVQTMLSTPFTNWDNQLKGEIDFISQYPISQLGSQSPEIWITEYNLRDVEHGTIGTWSHALFVAALTLQFLESPKVTKIVSHTMNGDANFGNIFSTTTGFKGIEGLPKNVSETTLTGVWEFTAMGSALNEIYAAVKNSTYARKINFVPDVSTQTIPTIKPSVSYPSLYGWYFDTTDSSQAVILNLDDNVKFDIDPIKIFGGTAINLLYEIITASDMVSGIIANPLTSVGPDQNHLYKPATQIFLANSKIELPPHSLLRIIRRNTSGLHINAPITTICTGSTTTFEVTGGISPYACAIPPGSGTVSQLSESVFQFTRSTGGSTTLTITDNGSNTETVHFTVIQNGSVSATASSDKFCPGDNPITLTATITPSTGASTPYYYIWVPDSGVADLSTLSTSSILVEPQRTTNYQVYTYDNMCWNRSNELVISVPVAEVSLGDDIHICNDNLSVDLVCNAVFSGTTSPSYTWTENSTVTSGVSTYTTSGNLTPTSTISVNVVNDGCSLSDELTVFTEECCPCVSQSPPCYSISATKHINNEGEVQYFSRWSELNALLSEDLNDVFWSVNPDDPNYLGIYGNLAHIIRIDGELVLKSNEKLEFDHCTFEFGENAKITVSSGCGLAFYDCTLNACSGKMWDGIIVDQKDGFIPPEITLSNCEVNDAKNAVVMRKNALFKIYGTSFTNNYIDLEFENNLLEINTTLSSNFVKGCEFTSNGSFLLPPYDANYKLAGILVNNTEQLQIGELTASNMNTFAYSNFGIHARNSGLTIYNSEFQNITKLESLSGDFSNTGTALSIKNQTTLSGLNITIGENSTYGHNTFTYGENGILLDGEFNAYVKGNTFGVSNGTSAAGAISLRCIEAKNTNGGVISITDANNFYDYFVGVHIHNTFARTFIYVDDNLFHEAIINTAIKWEGTAIAVMNPYLNLDDIYLPAAFIRNNQIGDNTVTNKEQARIGIIVSAISKPQIMGNSIYFHQTGSPTYHSAGISMNYCNEGVISSNTIENYSFVPGFEGNLRGISSTLTLNPCINTNIINNMGYSIYLQGDHGYAALSLNYFNKYDTGIKLKDAEIGVQGTTIRPDENEWHPDPLISAIDDERVGGNTLLGAAVTWYYNSSNVEFDPNVNGGNLVDDNPATEDNETLECPVFLYPYQRNLSYGRIVADSSRYNVNYQDELSYWGKKTLFSTIKSNLGLLDLDDDADDSFHYFYDLMVVGNLSRYDTLSRLIDTANFSASFNYVQTLTDTNVLERYLNEVYSIYLNHLATNVDLSGSDSSRLIEIASMNALAGGEATMLARNILFLEIYDDELSSLRSGNQSGDSIIKKLEIFPNPVKSTIFFKTVDQDFRTIKIYDLLGQVQKQCVFTKELNVSDINSGTYLIETMDFSGAKYYSRFIKIE